MAIVAVHDVSKAYGSVPALRGFSATVRDGEFLVLLGPSGCGKTTLLRVIAGLERPDRGEILIDGERVNEVAPGERQVSMVFQSYALYPHMTASANMGFSLAVRHVALQAIRRRVESVAAGLGIRRVLGRLPGTLSGGQRQRVAMGRSIVKRPRVFLFDEPLSNLDPPLRAQARARIKARHRELRTTTIYVTHDQAEAMALADRLIVMREGAVQQIGTPLELYDMPRNVFVAGFVGSPAMNLLSGTTRRRGGRTFVETAVGAQLPLGADEPVEEHKPVVYGIRPEHVAIDASGQEGVAMTVDEVELTGLATIVHGALAGCMVRALTTARLDLRRGQTIGVLLDPARAHLFDAATGLRCALGDRGR